MPRWDRKISFRTDTRTYEVIVKKAKDENLKVSEIIRDLVNRSFSPHLSTQR